MDPNEQRVRRMRDEVYGTAISDEDWLKLKRHWMQPSEIAWLERMTDKNKSDYNRRKAL